MRPMKEPAIRGEMIDVGGRAMHAIRAGAGGAGPLTVLEAGAFGFSADWAAVQARLAARGIPSLAYDRAGLGFSQPGPAPRDSAAIVGDLERLLAAASQSGPFVLCGHSMAGLHLRLFCARNAERVSGVVLVDATTPEAMDSALLSNLVGHFGMATRAVALAARTGMFGPLAGTSWGDKIGLEGAATDEKRWAFASARHNHWAAQEVAAWRRSAEEARQAGGFPPGLPVSVVLADAGRERGIMEAIQTVPALASHAGRIERVAGATHATILSDRHAGVVVGEIERVRAAGAIDTV
jgi:pimeloyl-ACP methyl ester carboxylesterase